MPEEINRLACDSIADYFLCTEENAIENLLTAVKKNCTTSLEIYQRYLIK